MKNINKIEDLFEEINETMTKEYGNIQFFQQRKERGS